MLLRRFPSLNENLPWHQGGGKRLTALEINSELGHEIALDQDMTSTITVTLIDANHCPGSSMILVQGSFGNRYGGACACQNAYI